MINELLIITITVSMTIIRFATLVVGCWLAIEAMMHINEFGLKHLLEVLWLGDT